MILEVHVTTANVVYPVLLLTDLSFDFNSERQRAKLAQIENIAPKTCSDGSSAALCGEHDITTQLTNAN